MKRCRYDAHNYDHFCIQRGVPCEYGKNMGDCPTLRREKEKEKTRASR